MRREMTIEPTIPGTGAGALLRLIRDGRASTRAELVELTGLARSTVAQRMDALLSQRLVVPAGGSVSTGGRPPQTFAFNRDAGVVLAPTSARPTRASRSPTSPARCSPRTRRTSRSRTGPTRCSAGSSERFDELLDELGRTHDDVRGVGVGVPGPVEFATGTPVAPPIMPGWDGYRVARAAAPTASARPCWSTTT